MTAHVREYLRPIFVTVNQYQRVAALRQSPARPRPPPPARSPPARPPPAWSPPARPPPARTCLPGPHLLECKVRIWRSHLEDTLGAKQEHSTKRTRALIRMHRPGLSDSNVASLTRRTPAGSHADAPRAVSVRGPPLAPCLSPPSQGKHPSNRPLFECA